MGDWLGTGTVASQLREYCTFKKARQFARSLKLKSRTEWTKFTKSGKVPDDIPVAPDIVYKNKGWSGMGDWLGTGTVATYLREYRTFTNARKFARSLKLKSETEWREFTKTGKLPDDIPANPNRTYKEKGWAGMGDWLGTGNVATYLREYRTFTNARQFAQSLNLKSRTEWIEFTKSGKLPDDIPVSPERTYNKKGWSGMGDWLGTGTVATHLRKYRTFTQARQFARSLKLKSYTEWTKFTKSGKLPDDLPVSPERTYKDKGWTNWGDWLGTGTVAPRLREYRTFIKARQFARSLKLKSRTEWMTFTKTGSFPADIPVAPNLVYKDNGWAGMGDWLGK